MTTESHRLSDDIRTLIRSRLASPAQATDPADSIPRRQQNAPCRLSFAQRRLWFLEQMVQGSPVYNLMTVQRLPAAVSRAAMATALRCLVERHEVLRTSFFLQDDEPLQKIHPPMNPTLDHVDLKGLPEATREEEFRRLANQEAQRIFDLTQPPLIHATLIELSPQESAFLLNMHHIVSDGWSLDIFWRELIHCYEAAIRNTSPSLPELPIQYADFATWQSNWLQGKVLDNQIAYWKEKLHGGSTFQLPSDRRKGSASNFDGRYESLKMSASLTDRLKRLSQSEEVTLFTTLLTALKVLVLRYTNEEDTIIGTPIAGRNRAEVEPLIGFFVNTLVMRTDLSGNPSFVDALHRVEETVLGAFAHQDLPFEMLVEKIQPERDLDRHPLFQIMFQLLHAPPQAQEAQQSDSNTPSIQTNTSKFDLTCSLWDLGDSIQGSVEYSTQLFQPETIHRFINNYIELLEAIVHNPGAPIRTLEFPSLKERRQLRDTWNNTATPYPAELRVEQRFEAMATRFPDRPAIETDDHTVTYKQLHTLAEELQERLCERGASSGQVIGICVKSPYWFPTAALAILKSGGCYLPLDPSYPMERLSTMVSEARCHFVITEEETDSLIPSESASRLCLKPPLPQVGESGIHFEIRGNADSPPPEPPYFSDRTGAKAPAYVMFTSGSTGTPKGVTIPHQGITRLVCATNYIQLEAEDRIAQLSNLAFDASTFELWGALLNGGCLVPLPKETLVSPKEFESFLASRTVSVVFVTTALLNQIAAEAPKAFSGIKHVLFGGEAVHVGAVQSILAAGPPRNLLHVYGPTECTTYATFHRITSVDPETETIPIGLPIANTTAHVLDPHLTLVPVGVEGELFLGGDGLACGYLHQPEWTKERFIPHPFSSNPKERLYRTGDRVRRQPNGDIVFVGRVDRQIKMRGFRIEPGEIENTLRSHPHVQSGLVLPRPDDSRGTILVAYFESKQHPFTDKQTHELKEFLRKRLPAYMVPQAFVPMKRLPLTANGKIDSAALESMEIPLPSTSESSSERFADEMEELIARVWMKVLEIPSPDPDTNFFDLGGHSLLMVNVQNRLQKRLNRSVTMLDLFHYPTIRTLASKLGEGGSEQSSADAPQEPRRPTAAPAIELPSSKQGTELVQRASDRIARQRAAFHRMKHRNPPPRTSR
uniref:Nonribosomal peptide synthetase/polyketide synthase hybrid n=1 Tax=Karenia brevis TaxID=156230 RepID=D2CZD5_KARBR|nr:nonribosomal peptide synthetase/polyketide synthase hybrid [Karenia brevis]